MAKVSQRTLRRLERDYEAMLRRFLTCPLDENYPQVEAAFFKLQRELEAARRLAKAV
jgi:hypothetical protein